MGTGSEIPLTKSVEECFFRNMPEIPVKLKTTKDLTKDVFSFHLFHQVVFWFRINRRIEYKMHSIMITSYECYGEGSSMLKKNLEAVFSQTYRPLQCIVSDHSKDNAIENMVKTLDHKDIDFIYVRYADNYGNPCHNWINALKYAKGDTLQYMCMDERPAHPNAMKDAIHHMNAHNAKWMVCAQIMEPGELFVPDWNEMLLYGANSVGGPAAAIFRSEFRDVTFDPQFNWLMDIDLYYRLYLVAGIPLIHTNPTFINTLHPNQLTHRVNTTERRNIEMDLICKKYGSPPPLCP